jgi:hypothetical protein
MKQRLLIIATVLLFISSMRSQTTYAPEKFGKTLNLGLGVGYYSYLGRPMPMGILNYEFDLFRNFTLAPFIGFYSYQNHYYWGDIDHPYRDYSYRETVIPLGVKGSYYFDELFNAGSKWDFYAALSLGFQYRSVVWESGYNGSKTAYASSASPLYASLHAGAEYHMSNRTGVFLDLSTSVSTIGLAFHFNN